MGARMTTSGCAILVSSAGRRVALIGCFRESAATLGIDLAAIATDLDRTMSAACQVAGRAFPALRCDSAEVPDRLLEICRAHAVDLVMPTIDAKLGDLSRSAERFRAIGTEVSVSAPEVVDLWKGS